MLALAAGLWLIRLGGYFLGPVGGALCLFASAWALLALRRARFQRPVSYQSVSAAFLPAELRDDNPLGVPQTRAAAGESVTWGDRWR